MGEGFCGGPAARLSRLGQKTRAKMKLPGECPAARTTRLMNSDSATPPAPSTVICSERTARGVRSGCYGIPARNDRRFGHCGRDTRRGNVAIALLANSLAIGAMLTVLILSFGPKVAGQGGATSLRNLP